MRLRTVVVEGPLALRTEFLDAARTGAHGLQVLTMEQLAVHLAGGFLRSATAEDLEPAIRSALDADGLRDLRHLGRYPGAVRAVSRTLDRMWEANLDLPALAKCHERIRDLVLIEHRVRQALPCGVLAPPDLATVATRRAALAPRLVGPVEFRRLSSVAPLWRDLVAALADHVKIRWIGRLPLGAEALPGDHAGDLPVDLPGPEWVACADPRAEVVEALRWVRELLVTGRARPSEIAIAAADPRPWDDAFLALRATASLPIHFTQGIPALSTRDGQACAALADLLVGGLSQGRVRRLLAYSDGGAPWLARLPRTVLAGVPRGAALAHPAHWRAVLGEAARREDPDPVPHLIEVLELAARGCAAAGEAGRVLLGAGAGRLWAEALRRAPAQAIAFTLETLRVADGRDPGDSVTWGPAAHVAASPRSFARLLGLTANAWPRRSTDDPLLPGHILDPACLGAPALPDMDRRSFEAIQRGATAALVLSRGRRNAMGGVVAPSPLTDATSREQSLGSQRIPRHAFSAADRLFSRAEEAAEHPGIAAATACALARASPRANAHDGMVRAEHPMIVRALGNVQSATSLRLLLRDPQGFTWRYALGWLPPPAEAADGLGLSARSHGELVHELLRRAVDALEPVPGFGRAAGYEVDAAVRDAADAVLEAWPLRRSTPPALLWRHTVDTAAEQALAALMSDGQFQPGTRSFTEVPFGEPDSPPPFRELPWDTRRPVTVPGTELGFEGRIDRIELRHDGGAVRLTDYKTGEVPKGVDNSVIQGGRELQRVLYSLAVLHAGSGCGPHQGTARLPAPGSGAVGRAHRGRRGHRRGCGPPRGGFARLAALRQVPARPGQPRRNGTIGGSGCRQPRKAMPPASARPSSAPCATSSGPGNRPNERPSRHRPIACRALDEHGSTLMVEAAAGTGKTSLIAGRITLLLAGGVAPSSIAAITFTESAATELADRVRRYVFGIPRRPDHPRSWRTHVPDGLAPDEVTALRAARDRLDELTTTTIHGFLPGDDRRIRHRGRDRSRCAGDGCRRCRGTVLDEVFSDWFRDRMSGEAAPGDPIAVLSRDDPGRVLGTLRGLTKFRIRHRSARPPAADLTGRPDLDLVGRRSRLSALALLGRAGARHR